MRFFFKKNSLVWLVFFLEKIAKTFKMVFFAYLFKIV